MHKIRIVGITVFSVLLFGCTVVSFVHPQREYSDRENRYLEMKPEISPGDILSGDYQEHYETYLTDQIFLRDFWVKLAVQMELLTGKREINSVYIGKNGYLLEAYGDTDFDPVQAEANIGVLAGFLNEAVQVYGKQNVTCMMLPSKANAMPDQLPDYAALNEEASVVEGLGMALEEPEILLDVGPVLRSHQDEYIYYRTDHHWTTLGAYYAYGAWADRTGRDAGTPEDYNREVVFSDFCGTTYNKVHLDVPPDCVELFHSRWEEDLRVVIDGGEEFDTFYFPEAAEEGFDRYRVFFSGNAAKIEIETSAGTGKSLLVIKDSFANCFVPFLAGEYDKIVMIDCRYSKEHIRDYLAEDSGITDVLVMYNIQKFMQDTSLEILNEKSDTVEEFDLEEFLEL